MCCKPLKGWIIGKTDSGKSKLKITSFDVHHLERYAGSDRIYCVKEYDNLDVRHSNPADSDISDYARSLITDYITIPCGKCIECLKQRGQEWTNRCLIEYSMHPDDCYFLTLTYRDADLPVTYYDDPDTGEAFPAYTLSKEHIQLFLKRLRKHLFGSAQGTLRYYVAGEYGPSTLRPHYHLLLFACPLDKKKFDFVPGTVYNLSSEIDKLWTYGFHSIAAMTPETMAYCCHYVTGKLDPDSNELYTLHRMQPPFALMSRRPGLGNVYYDEYIACVQDLDKDIYISTDKGGIKVKTPASFRRLAERDGIIDDAYKAARRHKVDERLDLELSKTNLDYYGYLDAKSRLLSARYNNLLKRSNLDNE